jgi:hypothetical protein
MSAQIEGVVTPADFSHHAYDGQLALWVDSWTREWRSCMCSVMLTPEGIGLYQIMYFRGDDIANLGDDDAYPPHLRLYSRDELSGARKMLQRLLLGNPRSIAAIAHHLAAEARS